MALTPAQLTILRNDILADPALAEQPMNSDGADAIAQAYKLPATPTFVVWRTSVPVDDIINNGFVWTAVDSLTVGKARIWDWMRAPGSINPSKANVRQGLQDAFGTSQPNIAQHLKREANRAERLFATGTGTTAAPGLMTFEGALTYQDVELARAS